LYDGAMRGLLDLVMGISQATFLLFHLAHP